MTSPNPAQFPQLDLPHRILLGPGPSMAHPRVLQAMTTPLIGYLDPCFTQLMDRTQELLRLAFETRNPVTFPIPGTGTSGMEASIANLVEPGDAVLACVNGFFGNRLAEMARRYGGDVETIQRPWGEVFSAADVRAALERKPAKVVAIVHAETSTGALQPLDEIAQVVHEYGGLLLVDAVTSLGGIPVRVDETGIDVCYSGSQKCLGCPPGSSPITINERAMAAIENRKTPLATYYLDLALLGKYWGQERNYHHTAPMSSIYGLYEGLRVVFEEGLEKRWARHRQNAELLWDGLEQIDLTPFVPVERRLTTLTTVRIPDGVEDLAVRQRLMNEYNIEIGGGLGELKGKIWRIGVMGYSSRPENIALLLTAFERILH